MTKKPTETQTMRPNLLEGMMKLEDVDDMLSELNTPGLQDVDFSAQRKVLESLGVGPSSAPKDKEETDLEDLFKQLQSKSGMQEREFDDAVSVTES
jgi:hypothetical protein